MKKIRLPAAVFLLTATLLFFVQWKTDPPLLLLERFFPGGGWIQILLASSYGALVASRMQDPVKVAAWRKYTWLAFSVVFFSQLILGLLVSESFLMSGKLHLPVPMMILAGPLYRGHISVMTILFLSTVLLSGPAWCSHLCYFGALDNLAASRRPGLKPLKNAWSLRISVLFLVVASALLLRFLKVAPLPATLAAGGFGLTGLAIIIAWSRQQGHMMHCIRYCPIGTVVNLVRHVNPFRLEIDRTSCTTCMACSPACNYDALKKEDIRSGKPGITCTLCGDCLSSCHSRSIRYRFLRMDPERARRLYLFITIGLHACTMALARI